MQLVFDTKGLVVTRLRGLFCVQAPDGTQRTISPSKVSSIAVTQSCTLHSGVFELAAAHEIPIYFLNAIGKVTARMGAPNFQSISTLRRQQVRFVEGPEASGWVTGLYLLKSEGQIRNVERLQKDHPAAVRMKSLVKKADQFPPLPLAEAGPRIMAMEAAVARQYWQALAQHLPAEYDFEKRNRRPAQDPFNASLNYYYGMLYTIVETALFAAGLDPHLGLLHADEYNKPVLAFDFIEPFRPWADWLLMQQFLGGHIKTAYFSGIPGGLALNKAGKAFLIPVFNAWLRSEHQWGGKKTSVKNHIYQLAGRFAQKLRQVT